MTGCFIGRREGNYRGENPGARGSERARGRDRGRELRAAPSPPRRARRAPHGAQPAHEIPKTSPLEMAATLVNSAGMLHWTVLIPPPPPGNVPRAARRRGRSPLHPRPGGLAGGRGPRRGAGWGRLYQARIPCNVEIPAFPCGMGVCTEFKSPTLKFMKLLPAAEGCMVCTDG